MKKKTDEELISHGSQHVNITRLIKNNLLS